MAMMTVYYGGYQPVENRKYEKGAIQKILEQGFTVPLLKSRHKGGRDVTIQKWFLSITCV